jgi:ATP-dependent protease ClpP protease subunit|tara:strand:- start:1883 stop:2644 length:762 start_codon:yes stop_codon:yes gene_type:complete
MKKLLLILLLLPTLAFAEKTIELNSKNTINFNQAFSGPYIASKQIEAINLCGKNVNSDIYIVAYTPGGSISAGQLFFDTLKALPCKFHTLTIFSASMGYQMTQNLGKRYILPSGTLMSHRASVSGISGELGGELDAIIKNLTDSVTDLEIVASKRVGITLEAYRDAIRDELWLTAEEAVKLNHADEIVLAKCDKSLMGTHIETVRTFFGSYKVEYSNCPIITSPLRVVGSNSMDIEKVQDYVMNIRKRTQATL